MFAPAVVAVALAVVGAPGSVGRAEHLLDQGHVREALALLEEIPQDPASHQVPAGYLAHVAAKRGALYEQLGAPDLAHASYKEARERLARPGAPSRRSTGQRRSCSTPPSPGSRPPRARGRR